MTSSIHPTRDRAAQSMTSVSSAQVGIDESRASIRGVRTLCIARRLPTFEHISTRSSHSQALHDDSSRWAGHIISGRLRAASFGLTIRAADTGGEPGGERRLAW